MATQRASASLNMFSRPTQQQNKILHSKAESSVKKQVAP